MNSWSWEMLLFGLKTMFSRWIVVGGALPKQPFETLAKAFTITRGRNTLLGSVMLNGILNLGHRRQGM